MLHRTLTALLASLLLLAGCGKNAEDKAQIREVVARLDNANNSSDGATAAAIFTDETFRFYEQLLPIGLNGTEGQVRALPSAEMLEVLLMRARGTRKELEKLDGRGYVEYGTSKGWYVTPPADRTEDTLRNWQFGNGWAKAEVVSDGEPTGIVNRFEKVDGAWKIDERDSFASVSRLLDKLASEAGVERTDFVLLVLEERLGEPVPGSVWKPMK